ncbi:MAG: type II toxin-antitoxin system death-on-curing family toxin [Planctomycetota bacterium]
MAPLYPTLEEALHLHSRLVERFGGEFGVRDLGLLESALARPRSGYYDSIAGQAAALLQSLALNHCFVDGNKRMAFALAAVFLRMNGWRIRVDPDEGERFLVEAVIVGKAELGVITAWLERRLQRLPPPA